MIPLLATLCFLSGVVVTLGFQRAWRLRPSTRYFGVVGLGLVLTVVLFLVALTRANADSGPVSVHPSVPTRYWSVSYNSALAMHQAAVPLAVYPVGTRLLLTYHHHHVIVHSIAGGCQCLDISDEAFTRLAGSTSAGVIRAKVEEP